jgi:phage-related protein (TIGR01555 family)
MPRKKTEPTTHLDSWQNIFTGLGYNGRDKTVATGFAANVRLTQRTLEDLYEHDGVSKRVVELPTTEMTRVWFTIKADTSFQKDIRRTGVIGRLEEIGAKASIRDMIRWAKVYGGSLGFMLVNDGQSKEEPLDETSIDSVDGIQVYDRFHVYVAPSDLYTDPELPKYNTPQWYTVRPHTLPEFRVHESRTLRLDGLPVSMTTRIANQGWGDSVYQAAFKELKNLGAVMGATANIVEDFVQAVVALKGLTQKIAAGQEGVVVRRLQMLDLSRSILNATIIDADGETYTKHSSSVAGLPEIITGYWEALACVTQAPLTLLIGRSPAGLNSTGDSDFRNYYDHIAGEQEDDLQPILERLVRLNFLAKSGPTKGIEPENWQIEFNPLWQMSEAEKATIYKTIAEADSANVSAGILDGDEIARGRYGVAGGFGGIGIDPRTRAKLPEPDVTPPAPTNGKDPAMDQPPVGTA